MKVSPLMVRAWRNNLARLLDLEQQLVKARLRDKSYRDQELIVIEQQIVDLLKRIEEAEEQEKLE